MATAFSSTVKATEHKPYILTHRDSGERYAYSTAHLQRTREMYRRAGRSLEALYTITKEWPTEDKQEGGSI